MNPPRSHDGVPRSGYRPALDGIRAVAVLAVVGYHLDNPWLRLQGAIASRDGLLCAGSSGAWLADVIDAELARAISRSTIP